MTKGKDDKLARHAELLEKAFYVRPELKRLYDSDPHFKAAWDDPDYDPIETLHRSEEHVRVYPTPLDALTTIPGELDMLLDSGPAELRMAWEHIYSAVRSGTPLARAVETWGIRGHPSFAEWFPVTEGPWGDEAFARREIDGIIKRQKEVGYG